MKKASKLIAIIEDDAVLRRGLKRFFENENCIVVDFHDGFELTSKLEKAKPDLILCDYNLPGENGLDILKNLRRTGSDVPFVLITGYYSEVLFESAKRNGALTTLEKPLELSLLGKYCNLDTTSI